MTSISQFNGCSSPLLLKLSASYHSCGQPSACLACMIISRLGPLTRPKLRTLKVHDCHLDIYDPTRSQNSRDRLESIEVTDVKRNPDRLWWRRRSVITLDGRTMSDGIPVSVQCHTRSESETREWQRALVLLKYRSDRLVSDIIDIYSSL